MRASCATVAFLGSVLRAREPSICSAGSVLSTFRCSNMLVGVVSSRSAVTVESLVASLGRCSDGKVGTKKGCCWLGVF